MDGGRDEHAALDADRRRHALASARLVWPPVWKLAVLRIRKALAAARRRGSASPNSPAGCRGAVYGDSGRAGTERRASSHADSGLSGAKLCWYKNADRRLARWTSWNVAPTYYGFKQRHEPQLNPFGLKCCDHFGLPTPDPDRAGKFYEQILGAVELFRAGYTDEDRAKKRLRHIFYHIGATLVELVEQEDGDQLSGSVRIRRGRNMNPHFAGFGSRRPEGVANFCRAPQTRRHPVLWSSPARQRQRGVGIFPRPGRQQSRSHHVGRMSRQHDRADRSKRSARQERRLHGLGGAYAYNWRARGGTTARRSPACA